MAQQLAAAPDLEHLLLDSTMVRAHPCAAGAPHKRGPGGPGTKSRRLYQQGPRPRGCVGDPLHVTLTGGQTHNITQATAPFAYLIADKGYDAETFVPVIPARGAVPVIPPRSNRKIPRV